MSVAFWIVMLVWFLFGAWRNWSTGGAAAGDSALPFLAVFMLGWATFGSPIR